MSIALKDVPFAGRPYAKHEAMTLAALGSRVPQGAGESLIVYESTQPFLYVPDNAGTGWKKMPVKELAVSDLTDFVGATPADGNAILWNAGLNKAVWGSPSISPVLPYARVRRTSDATVGASSQIDVTWTNEEYDTIGGFDLLSSSTDFVAPSAGAYLFTATVTVAYGSGSNDVDLYTFTSPGSGTTGQVRARVSTTKISMVAQWISVLTLGGVKRLSLFNNAGATALTLYGTGNDTISLEVIKIA